MNSEINSKQTLIILETDISLAKPFCEKELTPIQKTCYESFSETQREQIRPRYGAIYKDLESNQEICSFNMDSYKPPKDKIESFARSLVQECKKFYSDPENVKKFEEWKAQNDRDCKK